ncbi:hypothetical protein QTI66_06205 [Variovorax sp. J22R133]|uniref:hypothetical protein n=1 Tax=Variovorax brevis TaxID=3053503 RepID=UPI0025779900|nr:hypothetical protein [Variovorax sp. J22R133]MDM0111734.1 hypothetical protein [Variovorax sp. J22R133]
MNRLFQMRPKTAVVLCSAVLWGSLCGGALAAVFNPPIRMAHGVEYMSGGIGADEAQLMQTVAPRWPAAFEFAIKDGKGADFAADVKVTVRDDKGNVLLDHVNSGGPYFVARLEPGRYAVEATLAGQVMKQEITVQAGTSTRTVFEWPAGTDMQSARS